MRPQLGWTGLWQGWLGRWTQTETRRVRKEEQRLRQEMEAARREAEAAERYFQTVTEPELVDHAIFTMEAAKRKYVYLYRQLRRSRGGTGEIDQGESEWI
ncbi:MAG: DUF2508 family protein [Bacillota bacterium]